MSQDAIEPGNGHQGRAVQPVRKTATGVLGFDEITAGGIPTGRLTGIIGSAGAGKTVFALQTLVNRRTVHGEACIFVAFEESIDSIKTNAAAFDWPPEALNDPGLRFVDARLPIDAVMSGAFDLEGLVSVLGQIASDIDARNIVFDGIDMLFSGLDDERLVRQELLRLNAWVRRSGLSAVMTVKRFGPDDSGQRRSDFLQYMTDCMVILERHVSLTSASRTLRVSKYRGSDFVGNPVPYVIGRKGLDVVAFKGAREDYPTGTGRVSSGIPRLDSLLEGGYLRGASVLVSGSPGTSKTSLGSSFVAAACRRGEKALFVSFDESGAQIIKNMQSIGIDLEAYVAEGRLIMASLLSSGCAPENHFVTIRDLLERHRPSCLVIDPISSLLKADYPFSAMISEALLDQVKSRGITVLCTSLLQHVSGDTEMSASQVSTIADTWIHVSYIARDGERNRAITIVKARGTGHSNQVRELILKPAGIDIVDAYLDEGEVLMGSARAQKEADARRRVALAEVDAARRKLELEREVAELKARVQMATLELNWKEQESQLERLSEQNRLDMGQIAAQQRLDLRRSGSESQ